MKNALKTIDWLMLIAGVLITVLGIMMLFTPLGGLVTLAIFIGISMLISGIAEIAFYCGEAKGQRSGWMLASGIIASLLGIWTVFGNGNLALVAIIPFVFAAWIMTSSIMRIVGSVSMKNEGLSGWGWIMAFGIIGTALGFLLMFTPILSGVVVAYSIAFMFIAYGLNNIILFFRMRELAKHLRDGLGE